jgi:hypothetical protein
MATTRYIHGQGEAGSVRPQWECVQILVNCYIAKLAFEIAGPFVRLLVNKKI